MEIPVCPAMRHLALEDNRPLDRLVPHLLSLISEMPFAAPRSADLSCAPVELINRQRVRRPPAVGA